MYILENHIYLLFLCDFTIEAIAPWPNTLILLQV